MKQWYILTMLTCWCGLGWGLGSGQDRFLINIFLRFIKVPTYIQMKKSWNPVSSYLDQEVVVPLIFKDKTVLFSLMSFLSRNEKPYEAVAFQNLSTNFDVGKISKYHFPFYSKGCFIKVHCYKLKPFALLRNIWKLDFGRVFPFPLIINRLFLIVVLGLQKN